MSDNIPNPSGPVPPWAQPESKPEIDSTGFCLPIGPPSPKPLRMANDNKLMGYRSIEAIREKQSNHPFIYPADFPLQPFYEYDTLIKKLNCWAIKHGFSINKNGSNKGTTKHGRTIRIVCHCWGKPRTTKTETLNKRNVASTVKTDCPWAMYVEEAQNADGEIVFMVSNMADTLVNHTNSVNDDDNKYLQN